MKKNLVSGLFNRQLQKSLSPPTEAQPGAVPHKSPIPTGLMNSVVYQPPKPDVIVDEFISDAGVVKETRSVVNKAAEE
jgi:hypothetical protein